MYRERETHEEFIGKPEENTLKHTGTDWRIILKGI